MKRDWLGIVVSVVLGVCATVAVVGASVLIVKTFTDPAPTCDPTLDRAREGYEAAAAGIPAEACQYDGEYHTLQRKQWLTGWQQYKREQKK